MRKIMKSPSSESLLSTIFMQKTERIGEKGGLLALALLARLEEEEEEEKGEEEEKETEEREGF